MLLLICSMAQGLPGPNIYGLLFQWNMDIVCLISSYCWWKSAAVLNGFIFKCAIHPRILFSVKHGHAAYYSTILFMDICSWIKWLTDKLAPFTCLLLFQWNMDILFIFCNCWIVSVVRYIKLLKYMGVPFIHELSLPWNMDLLFNIL